MKRTFAICMAIVCALVAMICIAACRNGQEVQADLGDLLPGLVQGCKDNVASIKTGKGTVTIHSINYSYDDGEKVLETEGTYSVAFDGAKYRISGETFYIKNELGTSERAVKPGSTLPFKIACDGEKLTELRAHIARVGSVTTVMSGLHNSFKTQAALVLGTSPYSVQGICRIDLYPFLQNKIDKGLSVARRETLDGHECVVVERTVERLLNDGQKIVYTREYWVDPERGFAVPRVREWGEGGPATSRILTFEANTVLRDYGSGLWGPAKHTYVQNELDGKGGLRISCRSETVYGSDYRLNVRITEDDLVLRVPSGIIVNDLDTNEVYRSP